MSPDERSARAIWREFLDALNDFAGNHAMAVFGIIRVLAWAETLEVPNRTPESSLFVGHGDPNTSEGFAWQRWRLDDLPERLGAYGPVVRSLGEQWLVTVASQWNEHYRPRIAQAMGVPASDILQPLMADINRMRNDVIHHGGIATARNSGRCEVLRWFRAGEQIHVMMVHVAEVMHHLGLVTPTSEIDGEGPWQVREE